MATKNDPQAAAPAASQQQVAQTIPDVMRAIDQERQKNAALFSDVMSRLASAAEAITVLQSQLFSAATAEPKEETMRMARATLRTPPGAIVMGDGTRIVARHIAAYSLSGKTKVQLRAHDGSVLGEQAAPTHRNNQPIPHDEQVAIAQKMLRSLDELFDAE